MQRQSITRPAFGAGHVASRFSRVVALSAVALTALASGCESSPKGDQVIGVTVGGTVIGLAGTGLVLHNGSSGEDLAVSASGAFAFPTAAALDATYEVTVKTQPSGPTQVCTVTNGAGTVAKDSTINVIVTCETVAFSVGGTVSGLTGTGLVLQNNLGDDFTVTGNGPFTFSAPVLSGASYAVTVKTHPSSPTQICSVTGGAATVGSGPVTSVVVSCVRQSFAVGGTVAGLAGSGLVLQNNLGDDRAITANGAFSMPTPVLSDESYSVTVKTQPSNPTQLCTVTDGTGTVGGGDVSNVAVSCVTQAFAVGGTVSGLTGTGLVLQNSSGDDLAVAAGSGSFTFATTALSGAGYAVTVKTQPSNPTQLCTVTDGTGTVGGGPVSSVAVSCVTQAFSVGGTVSGLAGSGLVLQNNSGDDRSITANGAFSFTTSVLSGAGYAVTVKTQPSNPTQVCAVTGGTGTVGGGPVTSVAVSCVTQAFKVGGTVSGLLGTGLVLQNNSGNDLSITANGAFSFTTSVLSGASYAVTVRTPPNTPTQGCTVTGGTGTVGNGPVTSVAVSCVTQAFYVGGTVSGLTGTGLVLQNNLGNDLTVTANGAFNFTTPIASGGSYWVAVKTQPTGQTPKCRVLSGTGTGTVGGSDVTSVAVMCGAERAWGKAQLIEFNTGNAFLPQIAFDSAGNALAVWEQGDHIWANRCTAAGVWGTAQLIETGAGQADSPRIAVDAAGNAVAVFVEGGGVWANRYTAGGSWGTARLIGASSVAAAGPQVAIDTSGNAIAVWRQYDATEKNIWSNRYTAGAWGTAQLIETDTGSAESPQVAFDPAGNAFAVWPLSITTGVHIVVKRRTAAGVWGTAQFIEAEFKPGIGYIGAPQLAVDAAGNTLAVWDQWDGTTYNIWANRYAGGSWGTAKLIAPGADSPQVAVDPAGNGFAVHRLGTNRYTVGVGWGPTQPIATGTWGPSSPQVAVDAAGNAFVAWYEYDNTRYNVWSSRYVAGGSWGTAQLLETDNVGSASNPRIAVDSNGNAVAVWEQWDGPGGILGGATSNIWSSRYE